MIMTKRSYIFSLVCGLGLLSVFFNVASSANIELSSILQTEITVTKGGSVQKLESIWQPELTSPLSDEIDMTFIARLRADTQQHLAYKGDRLDTDSDINGAVYEGGHGDVEIREWYIDTEFADVFWRLGKQQVVWGQADGLKILDVVNPQSYREFILDDFENSRIPLWMVNGEIPIGDDDSLQLLWIFDQSYHRFANNNSDYQITTPLLVPQPVEGIEVTRFELHKPNNMLKDSDFGLRYAQFYQGWDLTFNYLYHYLDNPVFYQHLNGSTVSIDAKYERSHLFGLTASKAFDDWTIRSEVGYSTNTFHLLSPLSENGQIYINNQGIHDSRDISSVLGLDWQGLENAMLSIQWFQSSLLDYDDKIYSVLIRPKRNQIWSFLYQKSFVNDTWALEALVMYGVDQHDNSIQLELSYLLESNIKLWFSADLFGGNKKGLFGQFNDVDRLGFGMEWGF